MYYNWFLLFIKVDQKHILNIITFFSICSFFIARFFSTNVNCNMPDSCEKVKRTKVVFKVVWCHISY